MNYETAPASSGSVAHYGFKSRFSVAFSALRPPAHQPGDPTAAVSLCAVLSFCLSPIWHCFSSRVLPLRACSACVPRSQLFVIWQLGQHARRDASEGGLLQVEKGRQDESTEQRGGGWVAMSTQVESPPGNEAMSRTACPGWGNTAGTPTLTRHSTGPNLCPSFPLMPHALTEREREKTPVNGAIQA